MTSNKARLTQVQVRRARAAEAQVAAARAERRRRQWIVGAVGAALVVIAVVVWALTAGGGHRSPTSAVASSSPSAIASTSAPATGGRTSAPPWPVPDDASAAAAAAGLPMLGAEGNVVHIHTHLDVIVNGQPVAVPADIGIDRATKKISPLHTHDISGVIHVESPTKTTFTLGQLFTEWRVALTADRLGGLAAGADNQLRAYVNGNAVAGDPATITLAAHDEIALVYGNAAQQTNIPTTYTFQPGE